MTPVFGELHPLLKDIRTKLNDLTLQKAAPKVRKPSSRKKKGHTQPLMTLTNDNCFGGKAGQVAYPILVGETASLYKTQKPSSAKKKLVTLDLHGLTKEEALEKLDGSLPAWVDTAMKGEYPWVIPVNVICGGGSQVLSDVVKEWIRTNRQVANRPKNYV